MAQLRDDCFAFGGALLPVGEATRRMAEQVAPVAETEIVALRDAPGRVLAADLRATMALPPFDNSAVDGYAIRHADLAPGGETTLRIAGRVTAGAAPGRALAKGEAVRIFTGAPPPPGADTVFMQEDVRVEGETVVVPHGLKRGANFRLAGEDIEKDAVAIAAGCRLQAADVALAAALGVARLKVRRRLRVALFSTGDELVEPGTPLPGSAIYDSNRYLLLGLLRNLGAEVDDLGILRDDVDALTAALGAAAASHDLVITSGGVSTGEADHVKAAVERLGRLVFWRLAIKPGRPVAMGVIKGAAFVGLPGNPVAVFVTFINVVRPLLFSLAGAAIEPLAPVPARATFQYKKKAGRQEYLRATARLVAGFTEVDKHPAEGAGLLTSLTRSHGLVLLGDDCVRVDPGDLVHFLPYASLIH